jgi:hypothetical protein
MTDYNLVLRQPDGTQLAMIPVFENFDFAYKENEIGECILQIPSQLLDRSLLSIDNIIEIWRTNAAGITYLEGERNWYLRKWEFAQNGASDNLNYRLTLQDANQLHDRRIIAYAADSAQAQKTDNYDDMMKAMVRENEGALATVAARSIATYLTVEADVGLAPSGTRGFAWQNLLHELQEICKASYTAGAYLAFDTVWTAAGTNEFRTYYLLRGVDHGLASGDMRIVSVDTGSLANASLILDYTNLKNAIYVGGQGREDAREIITVTDATSIGASVLNRCEDFADASSAYVTAGITSVGNSALAEKRGRAYFTGNVVDTQGMQYGVHYGFGDIVVAQFAGYSIDCHIDTVHITYDKGFETLDIKLHGEMPL